MAESTQSILARVAQECGPPRLRVYVRQERPEDPENRSTCELRKRSFLIRIHPACKLSEYLECFVHELAHAYSWDASADMRDDHDAQWGISYARIYCAVFGVH